MDPAHVIFYVLLAYVLAVFPVFCCIVCFCSDDEVDQEEEPNAAAPAQLAVAVDQTTRTLPAKEQATRLAAAPALDEQARRSAAVEQARRLATAAAAAAEQARRLAVAAVAVAPVAKIELVYLPYSAIVEGGRGRAPGERQLVCAICLEVFVHGSTCSEVPACRHFFHRDCIELWMKNSNSACPLCRALVVPGSERLSAAEDMV